MRPIWTSFESVSFSLNICFFSSDVIFFLVQDVQVFRALRPDTTSRVQRLRCRATRFLLLVSTWLSSPAVVDPANQIRKGLTPKGHCRKGCRKLVADHWLLASSQRREASSQNADIFITRCLTIQDIIHSVNARNLLKRYDKGICCPSHKAFLDLVLFLMI